MTDKKNRSRKEIQQEILNVLEKHPEGCTVKELNDKIVDHRSRINSILYQELQKDKQVVMGPPRTSSEKKKGDKKPVWRLLSEPLSVLEKKKNKVKVLIDLETVQNVLVPIQSWQDQIDPILSFSSGTVRLTLDKKVRWCESRSSLQIQIIWEVAQTILTQDPKDPKDPSLVRYTFCIVTKDPFFCSLKNHVVQRGHDLKIVGGWEELEAVLTEWFL